MQRIFELFKKLFSLNLLEILSHAMELKNSVLTEKSTASRNQIESVLSMFSNTSKKTTKFAQLSQ